MKIAKKGDRVEFKSGDLTYYGVVTKGGSRSIKVTLDGGVKAVESLAAYFKLSDHPLSKDAPNLMDKYSITGLKEGGVNSGGMMWSATLRKNDKPIAHISQEGCGGQNNYQTLKQYEDVKQFKEDAVAWGELFNYRYIEIEDTWVAWWLDLRPYGVTAEVHLKGMMKE